MPSVLNLWTFEDAEGLAPGDASPTVPTGWCARTEEVRNAMGNFTFSIESNEVEERLDRLQQALGDLAAKSPAGGSEPTDFSAEWDAALAGDEPARERPHHQLSAAGQDFIVGNETIGHKPALKPYTIAGSPTIGYGHRIKEGEDFSKGITEAQARELLRQDIQTAVQEVNYALDVPISQQQFDALVDLAYNAGVSSVLHRHEVMKAVNTGHLTWRNFWEYRFATVGKGKVKKRVVSEGLIRRRRREWLIYDKGEY